MFHSNDSRILIVFLMSLLVSLATLLQSEGCVAVKAVEIRVKINVIIAQF
jgi:hypothetical protein